MYTSHPRLYGQICSLPDLLLHPVELVFMAPADRIGSAERLAEAAKLSYKVAGEQIVFEPIDILRAYRILNDGELTRHGSNPQLSRVHHTAHAILQAAGALHAWAVKHKLNLKLVTKLRRSRPWQLLSSKPVAAFEYGPVKVLVTAQLWRRLKDVLTVAELQISCGVERMKYMLALWHEGETICNADAVFTLPDGIIVADADVFSQSDRIVQELGSWLRECAPVHVLGAGTFLRAATFQNEPEPLEAFAKELSENCLQLVPTNSKLEPQFKVVQLTNRSTIELSQLEMNPIFTFDTCSNKSDILQNLYVDFDDRRLDLAASLTELFKVAASSKQVEKMIADFDEYNMPDCHPSQILPQAVASLICTALRLAPSFRPKACTFTADRYMLLTGEVAQQEYGLVARLAEYNVWGLGSLRSKPQMHDVFHVQPVAFSKLLRFEHAVAVPAESGTYMFRYDPSSETVKLTFNDLITLDDLRRCEHEDVR